MKYVKEAPVSVKMAISFVLFCLFLSGFLNPVATIAAIMIGAFCVSIYVILNYVVKVKYPNKDLNNEQATI